MSLEKNCQWYFAKSLGGLEQGPNDAMSETFKKLPYDALVRESIQNSLDAVKDPSQPVVMDFNFGRVTNLDYPQLFQLKRHILGCMDKYESQSAKDKFQPMYDYITRCSIIYYLIVSDSNTKGMSYIRNDSNSTFYSFVKCAGNSVKSNAGSGGSYGFGKAAYFNVSKIRTIMVSTQDEMGKNFFEGVASLCTHWLDNDKVNRLPVGYYCNNEEEEPISDINEIPEIFHRSESGTTVGIMGVDFDEMPKKDVVDEIIKAVISNFWCSILSNKLVVRIDSKRVISADNIEQLASEYFEGSDEDPKYARTRNPRPYIEAYAHAGEDDKHVEKRLKLDLLGNCKLYICKRKSGTDNILYMRSPRMLVYSEKNKSQYGFYGVFICDDKDGNELLKSIEDPSHREWDYKRLTDRNKLKQARVAMREMKDVINQTLQEMFVSADAGHIDIKGLEDYLYIPTESDEDNDESDQTSFVGNPTGKFLEEEGSSYTTDIDKPASIEQLKQSANDAGSIIIKQSTKATPDPEGPIKSGHGDKPRTGKKPGIPMPGDRKEGNVPDEDGQEGYFAVDIEVPYRTFSQTEEGKVFHYAILKSPQEAERVRLLFYSVGEDGSEEPLTIASSNHGNIDGNLLADLTLTAGSNQIRLRFSDGLKHSIKIVAQEMVSYEN